jgi:hypothetical protein
MKHSLFRFIRHKLLNEGKLLRYLSYAVGEVVLIIVGILMALKINDWNEDRKRQLEFDTYIVHLKGDVRTAMERAKRNASGGERMASQMSLILDVLQNPGSELEDIQVLERGLDNLGMYPETRIEVGYLGRLMNGDLGIIVRDQRLAREAMEADNELKSRMSVLLHIEHQIDLLTPTIAKYRGRAIRGEQPVALSYDIEELRSSKEFLHAAQTLIEQTRRTGQWASGIARTLESFLTVLEEYE